MAGAGGQRMAELLRRPDECPLPAKLHPCPETGMAEGAASAVAAGSLQLATAASARRPLLANAPDPTPMAEHAVRRQIPEVGAGCVNAQVRICAGGAGTTSVPTATDLKSDPRTPTATTSISTCPRLDRNGPGEAGRPASGNALPRRSQDTAPSRAPQEKTSNKNDTFSPPSPIARHRRAAAGEDRRRADTAAATVPPRETSRSEKVPAAPETPSPFPQTEASVYHPVCHGVSSMTETISDLATHPRPTPYSYFPFCHGQKTQKETMYRPQRRKRPLPKFPNPQ